MKIIKKIFAIISLLFSFSFFVHAEENKLPAFVETSIGKFVLESHEANYTCITENDGKEIYLTVLFDSDGAKSKIIEAVGDLEREYLKLPEKEKQLCLYAAENAAGGKYKDIISKTGRINSIMLIEKNDENIFLYFFNTEEHIHGCDFVNVMCDLEGKPVGAYLYGW